MKHHAISNIYINPTPIYHNVIKFKDEDRTEWYPDDEQYVDTELTHKTKVYSLTIMVFKGSSHANFLDTTQSVTGIFIPLGGFPKFYYSQRQNIIKSSAYRS